MTKQETYLYLYSHAPATPRLDFDYPMLDLSTVLRAWATKRRDSVPNFKEQLRAEWEAAGSPLYARFESEGYERQCAYSALEWANKRCANALLTAQAKFNQEWPKQYADTHIEAAWKGASQL